MNAGRIFRDDPSTRTTTASLLCDTQTVRMQLSRHIADVESGIGRLLRLPTETADAHERNRLREACGNAEHAARALAALARTRGAEEPRTGWCGRAEHPAAIDRPRLVALRDEFLQDARLRLTVLRERLAARGALGEGLRDAAARLDALRDLMISLCAPAAAR